MANPAATPAAKAPRNLSVTVGRGCSTGGMPSEPMAVTMKKAWDTLTAYNSDMAHADYKTLNAWLGGNANCPTENVALMEYIPGDRPVKIYGDVDLGRDDPADLAEYTADYVRTRLMKAFPEVADGNDICIAQKADRLYKGKMKRSFHFTIRSLAAMSGAEVGRLMAERDLGDFCDKAVYKDGKGLFCCIKQSFKDDGLVFVPLAAPGAEHPRGFHDYFVTRLTGAEQLLGAKTPAPVKTPSLTREGSVAGSSGGDAETKADKVRKLLSCISADCDYPRWFSVSCVLHDELDDDTGYEIFDAWSATAPARYNKRVVCTQWDGGKVEGKYTLGTLVKYARDENPERYAELFPKGQHTEDEADDLPFNFFAHYTSVIMALPEAKRTYDVVKRAFERQYFHMRMGGDTYGCHRWDVGGERSVMTYDKTKLKAQNENVFYWAPDKKDGEYEKKVFVGAWMSDTFKKYYERIDFVPPPMVCPPNVLNAFTGFVADTLPPSGKDIVTEEDIAPFIAHLGVLTDDNPYATKYLLSWLAQLFQQPGKLAGTYVIFGGSEGAGKSFITRFVGEKLMGDRYFYTTDNAERDVFGRFSNGRIDKLLLNFEEAKQLHKYYDNLKDLVTSTRAPFEQKGVMSETRRVYNRVVMTTNNRFPITVEPTDRRVVAVWASKDKCNDREYFSALSAWCEDPVNVRLVYEFLMSRDISQIDFVKDRPVTSWCNDMKARSLRVSYQFLLALREECHDEAVTDIGSSELMMKYLRWASENNQPTTLTATALTVDVKTAGAESIKVAAGRSAVAVRGVRLNWEFILANIGM